MEKESCFFLPFLMFIYFWETEKKSNERGRGRERDTHRVWSRLQALSCQHRIQHGAQTHEPWDHGLNRSWMLNQLSHPGAPMGSIFFKFSFIYFERKIESQQGRGRERERETECQASSALSAQSRVRGPNSTTELWDHDMSWSEGSNA